MDLGAGSAFLGGTWWHAPPSNSLKTVFPHTPSTGGTSSKQGRNSSPTSHMSPINMKMSENVWQLFQKHLQSLKNLSHSCTHRPLIEVSRASRHSNPTAFTSSRPASKATFHIIAPNKFFAGTHLIHHPSRPGVVGSMATLWFSASSNQEEILLPHELAHWADAYLLLVIHLRIVGNPRNRNSAAPCSTNLVGVRGNESVPQLKTSSSSFLSTA